MSYRGWEEGESVSDPPGLESTSLGIVIEERDTHDDRCFEGDPERHGWIPLLEASHRAGRDPNPLGEVLDGHSPFLPAESDPLAE
jgi:hypothetical protein